MTIKLYVGQSDLQLTPVLTDDSKTVRETLTENRISFTNSSFVMLDEKRIMNLDASLASSGATDESVLRLSEVKNGANN